VEDRVGSNHTADCARMRPFSRHGRWFTPLKAAEGPSSARKPQSMMRRGGNCEFARQQPNPFTVPEDQSIGHGNDMATCRNQGLGHKQKLRKLEAVSKPPGSFISLGGEEQNVWIRNPHYEGCFSDVFNSLGDWLRGGSSRIHSNVPGSTNDQLGTER